MAEESGPKIRPEQVIEIVLRRRWLIMVPLFLTLIVGIFLAITLPRVYQASTLILVQPQKVPTNYVQSVVSLDLNSRISTLSQQIMSRTNIEKIIEQFRLFEGPEYDDMYYEDKLANVRKRIEVKVTRARQGADAFTVSFKGKDPEKVMNVANALASFFIDENLKLREQQAMGTSSFLDTELEDKRKELERLENTLKEYRQTYMGELPEQLDTNLRVLDRLQEELSSKQEMLRDDRNRLILFDKSVKNTPREEKNKEDAGGTALQVAPSINESKELQELNQLREQYNTLLSRYTERHPDVIRLKRLIEQKEKVLEEDSLNAENISGTSMQSNVSMEKAKSRRKLAQLKRNQTQNLLENQRAEIVAEIKKTQEDIELVRRKMENYTKRVENTPKREQELLSIKRDYDNIRDTYNSILQRKLEAELAVNMEKRQKGEQFRVLDSAKKPEKPISPDMKKIFILILAAGIGLGGGIAFLLEFMDHSFRWPDEIESYLGVNVLAAVPVILSPKQKKIKLINIIASIIFVLLILGLIIVFSAGSFIGVEKLKILIDKILIIIKI